MELSACAASLLMIQNYEERLIPQFVVLPFRGASTGCRNGQRKTSLFQQREMQIPVPREKQPSTPIHAGDQTSGAQLYRESPRVLVDTKLKASQQLALAAKKADGTGSCIRVSVASKWKKVISAQGRTHLEYDF